jgi:hypothetical protein
MVLSLAGRDVPIELAIFRELSAMGEWDLDLIDAHVFAWSQSRVRFIQL